jgi:UDP-N-acetylmuramyl pentapeptide phosphotransferase/UDP-N-acetylglucosamine-1-phosphate transferase
MTGFASLAATDIAMWLAAVAVLSAALTGAAHVYARRRLLDLPGQRRSHTAPTPRGGGIGLCIAGLIGLVALSFFVVDVPMPTRLIAAIALVAFVGWIDDHRPLPILVRLITQIAAVMAFLWPIVAQTLTEPTHEIETSVFLRDTALLLVLIGLGVWSINLHNFMDGIDGILATQAIFVLTVLAWLCARDPHNPHGLQAGFFAAATLGFLPFNFPRARIFMGDVGSGTLGLVIFVAAVWQFYSGASAAMSALVVGSAFVTDATCTLLSRMFGGKRWYEPHREHLYQWMTRTGMSHARVTLFYAVWNLAIVLPVIAALNMPSVQGERRLSWLIVAALYIAAIIVWICGKRWCLYKVNRIDARA